MLKIALAAFLALSSIVVHADDKNGIIETLKTENDNGTLVFSRCEVQKNGTFEESQVIGCRIVAKLGPADVEKVASQYQNSCSAIAKGDAAEDASVAGVATFALVMTPSLPLGLFSSMAARKTIPSSLMIVNFARHAIVRVYGPPIVASILGGIGYYFWDKSNTAESCKKVIAKFLELRHGKISEELPSGWVQYQTVPKSAWDIIRWSQN